MNLEQLEAIQAVVEKGSFRAAAEHLNRSQPALSTTIKNLEEEFDLLIFDRSTYRPTLTEAGAVFLNAARTTLDAAAYASRVATELGKNKAESKLRVSVDPLISLEVIEFLAQECARPALPVDLLMDRSILRGSHQDLLDGKIDLAFAPDPKSSAKIQKIQLESVKLVSVVSRKLLQEKHWATAGFLSLHPQILVYDRKADEGADDLIPQGLHPGPGPKIYVPDHFTKLRLIAGGIGWGRISEKELKLDQDLVAIDPNLCETVTFDLCILRAKQRPIGPVARMIWTAFEKRAKIF